MKNKIIESLSYLFCAGLGLLNFILFAFPYVAIKMDMGEYGAITEGVNGYLIMDFFDTNFGGVMTSLIQIFILLLGIAMLILGTIGLLKNFGILSNFPDNIGKYSCNKIAERMMYIFVVLLLLLLVFLIIFVSTYGVYIKELGVLMGYGMRLVIASGVFISIVVAVVSIIVLKILQNKYAD